MSESGCLQVSELEAAMTAPFGDPRQQHLAGCPRCQALAAEFVGFMAGGADGVDLTVREISRLDQALAREMSGETTDVDAPFSSRDRRAGLRWPAWWVTVPTLAALVALAVIFPSIRVVGPDPGVMRGDRRPDMILVSHPAQVAGANLELAWAPAPGADSYAVQLLAADLTVAATVAAGSDTLLVLSRATEITPTGARFWRVTGSRSGDVIARSGLRELPQ